MARLQARAPARMAGGADRILQVLTVHAPSLCSTLSRSWSSAKSATRVPGPRPAWTSRGHVGALLERVQDLGTGWVLAQDLTRQADGVGAAVEPLGGELCHSFKVAMRRSPVTRSSSLSNRS